MEDFFGILKTEMFYDKNFESIEALIQKVHDYIEFYNKGRFQAKLGALAPLEYRKLAFIA